MAWNKSKPTNAVYLSGNGNKFYGSLNGVRVIVTLLSRGGVSVSCGGRFYQSPKWSATAFRGRGIKFGDVYLRRGR